MTYNRIRVAIATVGAIGAAIACYQINGLFIVLLVLLAVLGAAVFGAMIFDWILAPSEADLAEYRRRINMSKARE